MGIVLGLLIGKPVGIFAFSLAAIRLRLASKPEGATWPQIFGVAILGGIGFTMSLFIGGLAFEDQGPDYAMYLRLGVLGGSLLAGVLGTAILLIGRAAPPSSPAPAPAPAPAPDHQSKRT
jgi:NhaA family Na+:H+ antiporter